MFGKSHFKKKRNYANKLKGLFVKHSFKSKQLKQEQDLNKQTLSNGSS